MNYEYLVFKTADDINLFQADVEGGLVSLRLIQSEHVLVSAYVF